MAEYHSNVPEYVITEPQNVRTREHGLALRYIQWWHPRPKRHVGAGALGIAMSLVIHVLLVGSFLSGGATVRTKRPAFQGIGASVTDSDHESVMTMILISEPQSTQETSTLGELPSRGLTSEDLEVRVLSPDPYPAIDLTLATDNADLQSPDVHDATARAMLFGRYVGQIDARIERAWLRPRTAIGDTTFQCQVSIAQDSRGNVTEVALQNCNGSTRWQQSLVTAIQSASPLPAPPVPDVFSSTVTLRFESAGFTSGATSEGFEPSSLMVSADIVPPAKSIADQSSPTL